MNQLGKKCKMPKHCYHHCILYEYCMLTLYSLSNFVTVSAIFVLYTMCSVVDVEYSHVRFLGNLVLNLWDCGGYVISLLISSVIIQARLQLLTFSAVKLLVK